MAQAWSSLGSRVTLVHRGDRLIEREEPFASEQVETALREAGVDIRVETEVSGVSRNGVVRIELDDGQSVEADEILVSIGPHTAERRRRARHRRARAGEARLGRRVAPRSRHEAWLYAVGDVNGRALLTHMGKYQARLAADAISARRCSSARTAAPRRG
jgi:dihydrolipoamide dehydrogenase